MITQAELLISLRMSLTVSLLFLLFISGVVAQNGWSVRYNQNYFCALKGSEVTMSCTYTYPSGYKVQKAFWTKQWGQGSEPPDLSDDPEYSGRVQYLGDKHSDCTLRLSDVREEDQSKYYFRFITDQTGGRYQGAEGVDLSVTDLQVEVPERVIEGDKVTLTCKTTCSLTVRPTFTWYRNGHRLSSSTDQLHLQPVSREDAGRYRCAVLGLRSPEVTLNVRYGPKSISVSVSPSGEIVEGSSVTLTCSSDANPPVEYNWFKGTSLVAKGETYTMNKISSVDSGEYKCRSSNEHGEKLSEALTLNVLYPPKNISVSISPSGEIVEGSSVTLTCSSDANPPVQSYTWFKEGGSSPVGSGHSYRALQSGSYYCVAQNEHGSQKSAAVTVTVKGESEEAIHLIMQTKHRQNVDTNAKDDTYTALDPVSRSSDDVYCTLTNVDPNAKDDTYTALDPVSRSSDDVYNTLTTVHSSPSDDLYSALDPQSRSPEYDTLAVVLS
ncbi:B-cell receptor CD22-like [Colossoma macropomum]|uniref:B-cell receptor CD22-like n=1 Tax=Colossoma macropomum TaxID=42526 RepID=UPI0018652076|nr:B-cell receptor CD22-like [Colossoma macropomum]